MLLVDTGASMAGHGEVLDTQRRTDFTAHLPDITVPVTVVHGEFDRARPDSWRRPARPADQPLPRVRGP